MNFLEELEQMILHRYKSSQPSGNNPSDQGMSPDMGGMDMSGLGGGQEPISVAPVESQSRGPTPYPDMGAATAQLQRMMAGS